MRNITQFCPSGIPNSQQVDQQFNKRFFIQVFSVLVVAHRITADNLLKSNTIEERANLSMRGHVERVRHADPSLKIDFFPASTAFSRTQLKAVTNPPRSNWYTASCQYHQWYVNSANSANTVDDNIAEAPIHWLQAVIVTNIRRERHMKVKYQVIFLAQ